MVEFTVKEVKVFRVATFLNEVLSQIYFVRNLGNFQHISQYKSGLSNVISIRNKIIRYFDDSNFDIGNYCSFSSDEFAVGKN